MTVAVSSAESPAGAPDVTVDAFLGGRLEAVQPASGHHRAGLEAVLLSAALPATTHGRVVDLGAGVGVAGLSVAARCSEARVVLLERDPVLIECARATLALPANTAFAGRVDIVMTDIATRDGLKPGMADAVIFNPPFREAGAGSASPAPARASAHVLGEAGLDLWFRAAAALLKAGGTATVIFRADGLDVVLAAATGRFGAVDVLPVAPRPGEPAHRVVVRGVKGSRAPLRLLPPVVLHNETGNAFRPVIEAILREGRELVSAVPAWQESRGRPS